MNHPGPTPATRAKAVASRAAAIASTPATTRPGSETTTLTVGDKVRASRTRGGTRTWAGHNGREGWVVVVNPQQFPSGTTYVEIGVTWTRPRNWKKAAAEVWFRADELTPATTPETP
jgi:hypothetical protein